MDRIENGNFIQEFQLEDFTIPDLIVIAKFKGIKIPYGTRKADIIALIKTQLQQDYRDEYCIQRLQELVVEQQEQRLQKETQYNSFEKIAKQLETESKYVDRPIYEKIEIEEPIPSIGNTPKRLTPSSDESNEKLHSLLQNLRSISLTPESQSTSYVNDMKQRLGLSSSSSSVKPLSSSVLTGPATRVQPPLNNGKSSYPIEGNDVTKATANIDALLEKLRGLSNTPTNTSSPAGRITPVLPETTRPTSPPTSSIGSVLQSSASPKRYVPKSINEIVVIEEKITNRRGRKAGTGKKKEIEKVIHDEVQQQIKKKECNNMHIDVVAIQEIVNQYIQTIQNQQPQQSIQKERPRSPVPRSSIRSVPLIDDISNEQTFPIKQKETDIYLIPGKRFY